MFEVGRIFNENLGLEERLSLAGHWGNNKIMIICLILLLREEREEEAGKKRKGFR